MRFKLYTLLIFMFFSAIPAYCKTKAQALALFYEGNAYYSEEKFEEAITAYEKILGMGYESGALYYNLANAYFKHGSLGKAILNYLRAKKLIPQDADLKSNLDYAHSLVKGGIVGSGRSWFRRFFFTLVDSFSLETVTVISTILYFTLAVSLIFTITMKNLRKVLFYVNILLFMLLIIFVSFFAVQYTREFLETPAVVTAHQTDCKFEPFLSATTFFTLYEGESVSVLASRKDWLKIRRPDGKQGWIKASDIEFL